MKWYNGISIVGLCFLLSLLFIFLSFLIKDSEWWPEFLFILAEAALSVVIVLKIIDRTNRKERELRWEKIKLLIYSQILVKLGSIILDIGVSEFMREINPNIIPDIANVIINKDIPRNKLASNLAESIRNEKSITKKIINFNNKKDGSEKEIVTDLVNCLDKIICEIDEYRVALIPRIMDLSDEEVAFELLEFEKYYVKFHNLADGLRKMRNTSMWWIFVKPTLIALANFLDNIAYLYELIQREMAPKPETSLIEEYTKRLKYWWWPYE